MGNSTPCKTVTPRNFNLKLCTREYVGETTHYAHFGFNPYSGGFSPNFWQSTWTTLWIVAPPAMYAALPVGANVTDQCCWKFSPDLFLKYLSAISRKALKTLLRIKSVVDFLLVLTELFARCHGWGATSEHRLKISDFAPTASALPKISGRRGRPHQIFLHC